MLFMLQVSGVWASGKGLALPVSQPQPPAPTAHNTHRAPALHSVGTETDEHESATGPFDPRFILSLVACSAVSMVVINTVKSLGFVINTVESLGWPHMVNGQGPIGHVVRGVLLLMARLSVFGSLFCNWFIEVGHVAKYQLSNSKGVLPSYDHVPCWIPFHRWETRGQSQTFYKKNPLLCLLCSLGFPFCTWPQWEG